MCIEIAKDRMTIQEARRALPELIETTKNDQDRRHFQELNRSSDEELEKIAQQVAEDLGEA
jgi:hypothetical protein